MKQAQFKPFFAINCAALPAPELLESELFGHSSAAPPLDRTAI